MKKNGVKFLALVVFIGLIVPMPIFPALAPMRQAAQRALTVATKQVAPAELSVAALEARGRNTLDFAAGLDDILAPTSQKLFTNAIAMAAAPKSLPSALLTAAPATAGMQNALFQAVGLAPMQGQKVLTLGSLTSGPLTLSPTFAGNVLGTLRKAGEQTTFNQADLDVFAKEVVQDHKNNTGKEFPLVDAQKLVTTFGDAMKEFKTADMPKDYALQLITAWTVAQMKQKQQFLDMLLSMDKVVPLFKNPSFAADDAAQKKFLLAKFNKTMAERFLEHRQPETIMGQEAWHLSGSGPVQSATGSAAGSVRIRGKESEPTVAPKWLQKTAKEFPIKIPLSKVLVDDFNYYQTPSRILGVKRADIKESRFKLLHAIPHELTHGEQFEEGRLGKDERADEIEADKKYAIKTGATAPLAREFLHMSDFKTHVPGPEHAHPAHAERVAYLAELMRQNYKTPESVNGRIGYINAVAKSRKWQADEESKIPEQIYTTLHRIFKPESLENVESMTAEERRVKQALVTATKSLDTLLKQANLNGFALKEFPAAIAQLRRCDRPTKLSAAIKRLDPEVRPQQIIGGEYYTGKEYFSCEITQFGNEVVTIGNLVGRYIKPELAPAIEAIINPLKQNINDFFASEFHLDLADIMKEAALPGGGGVDLDFYLMNQMVENYQEKYQPLIEQLASKLADKFGANSEVEILTKKDNYRSEFLPLIKQLVPKIAKRDRDRVLAFMLREDNYRPEFLPILETILSQISDKSELRGLAEGMTKKGSYHAAIAPFFDMVTAKITDEFYIAQLAEYLLKKENYSVDLAPHVDKVLSRITDKYRLSNLVKDLTKKENYRVEIAPYVDKLILQLNDPYVSSHLIEDLIKKENYRPEIAPFIDRIVSQITDQFKLKSTAQSLAIRARGNPEIGLLFDKAIQQLTDPFYLTSLVVNMASKSFYYPEKMPYINKAYQKLTNPYYLGELTSDLVKKENYHSAIEPLIEQSLIKITDPQKKAELTEQLRLRKLGQ